MLLYVYVGVLESNMEFSLEKCFNYAGLGCAVWSLLTLIQGYVLPERSLD